MNDSKTMTIHYFLRGIILFGFALFIVLLVKSDSIVYYIAPRMTIYVKLSAMALYAISVYQIYLGFKSLGGKATNTCDCQHPPSRSVVKNIIIYSLFIFPLFMGFVLPNTVMGSTLAAMKGMNLSSSNSVKTAEPSTPLEDTSTETHFSEQTDNTISEPDSDSSSDQIEMSSEELEKLFQYDIFTEFYAKFAMELYKNKIIPVEEDIYIETLTTLDLFLDSFIGKKIELKGFVYREDSMSEEQFVVGRFAMQCCSADASPYGILVKYDDAMKIANDEWVNVVGTISKTTFNDFEIMLINVEQLEKIEQPSTPYVYPNYDFGL